MGVCYIDKLPLKQLDAYEQTEESFDYVIFGLTPRISKDIESSVTEDLPIRGGLGEILGDRAIWVRDSLLDKKSIQNQAQEEVKLIETSSPGESRRRYFEIYKKKPLYTYLQGDVDGMKIGFIAGTKISRDSAVGDLIEVAKRFSKDVSKSRKALMTGERGQWDYVEDRDIKMLPEVFSDLRDEGYIPTLSFYIEMCKTGRMRIGAPRVEGISNDVPLGLIESGFYCVGEDFPGIDREWGSFKNPLIDNERMYFVKVSYPEKDNFEQRIIEQYREPVFVEYINKLAENMEGNKNEPGPMVRVAKLSALDNIGVE